MHTDEQSIRKLVSDWMDATKAGDAKKVLSLMTDDVVFLVPGHAPMGKAEFAAAQAGQAKMKIEGLSDIQEITVLGDWAFMWSRLKVTVIPPGGDTLHRAGHTLSVLRKENGEWRLARDANMLSPES